MNIVQFPTDKPIGECVTHDADGHEYYKFAISYEFHGRQWGLEIWARSFDEATQRLNALRFAARLDGQIYEYA
jgi:hypothetical protein